ncbi:chaperone SicP [Shewanella surugensis]|uniref:Chaperone SicP n=1 Tax=Shewanella surugensis TaxID=212020 RepID=A0ABT0L7Q3_9GAMM|nr:chaperone SicP [Shewanella surugensis]MCL1123680.1 chaperone SicP [Shewanella surugensis]
METNHRLLKQLGDYLGLPLAFNNDDQCLMVFDGKLMVSIRNRNNVWEFQCMLSEMSLDTPVEYYQSYLMLNFELANKMLGSICYESNSRALMYVVPLAMPASYESLLTFLEEVLDQYEALYQKIKMQGSPLQRKQNTPHFTLA